MTDKMHKMIKILLIMAAVSLVALAVLIFTVDFPRYFTGEYYQGKEYYHQISLDNRFDAARIRFVDVNLASDDVLITPIEGEEITLLYSGMIRSSREVKEPYLMMDVREERLTIKVPERVFVGIGFFSGDVRLELGVPENRLEAISVDTSSGNIRLSGNIASLIDLDTSSGSLEITGYSGKASGWAPLRGIIVSPR